MHNLPIIKRISASMVVQFYSNFLQFCNKRQLDSQWAPGTFLPVFIGNKLAHIYNGNINCDKSDNTFQLDKGLKICEWNICSLPNKLDELKLTLPNGKHHKINILCITETWLNHTYSDVNVQLQG